MTDLKARVIVAIVAITGVAACSGNFPVPEETPQERGSVRLSHEAFEREGVVFYPPRGWTVVDLKGKDTSFLPPEIEDTREEPALLLAWDPHAVGFPPYLTVSVMNMRLPSEPGWLEESEAMLSETYRQRFDDGSGFFTLVGIGHIDGLGEHTLEIRYRYRYDDRTLVYAHEVYASQDERTVLITCLSPVEEGVEDTPTWCLQAFQGVSLARPKAVVEE